MEVSQGVTCLWGPSNGAYLFFVADMLTKTLLAPFYGAHVHCLDLNSLSARRLSR